MAAAKPIANSLVVDLWREKIDVFELKRKVNERKSECLNDAIVDKVVHTVYNGKTANGIEYLNKGIAIGVFAPNIVIDHLAKLSLGKKLKCFSSALNIVDVCSFSLRHDKGKESSLVVCKSIAKAAFWIFENTIELVKLLYHTLKDGLSTPDPGNILSVVEQAHELLKKLICSPTFEDLNFIGKLLFAEEFPSLQNHVKELLSLPLDKITSNPLYTKYENNLKELVNLMTKFLNTSPVFMNYERPLGESPCSQLFPFLQFQVLDYLSVPSNKWAELFDMWLKIENFAVNQVFFDLVRFSIHNILTRNDQSELVMFTSFILVKLPSILCEINLKYYQQGDQSIIYNSCQQIGMIDFGNLNTFLSCDVYKLFIGKCQAKRGLDSTQVEKLLSYAVTTYQATIESNESAIFSKLTVAIKKLDEILSKLALSLDENRDAIAQELISLIASQDNFYILIAAASTDSMKKLISALMRINAATERCSSGSQDLHADVRADLFNNSFLLLAYIGTVFGEKVFNESAGHHNSAFFITWTKNCTNIISRKMYTQSSMDAMLEPIPSSLSPHNLNAQWDEYCWSVGMIVKELTQAHLRRHINTDDLQKICEGFKNKKPALCICAMTWLCSQYKTMPTNERARTVKIINLFKRPTKTVLLNTVLNKYSVPLEPDLQAAAHKNKAVSQNESQSAGLAFTNLIAELCGPSNEKVTFTTNSLKNTRKWFIDYGTLAFTETIIKLILDCGKEEDCRLYEELCICLVLMEPLKIFQLLFTRVLKSFFHCPRTSKTFSNPQGLCLARCLSKSFAIALILYDVDVNEMSPRPAKSIKLGSQTKTDRELLVHYYVEFLKEAVLIFSTNQKNAVTKFLLNMIEQTSMALSLFKTPVAIDEKVATELLEVLPLGISRGTVTMLCNVATVKGQEIAANVFFRQSTN